MKICMILKRNMEMLKSDSRVLREATTLLDAGHEVWLLIYSADNEEVVTQYQGIKIKQIKIDSFWKKEKFNIFSQKNVPYENKIWKLFFYLPYSLRYTIRCLEEVKKLRAEVIHCHDLETLGIGSGVKNNSNKLVYDSHELWTESNVFSIFPALVKNILKCIYKFQEKRFLRKSDLNITVNEGIADYLDKSYKLIKKFKVIRNLPDLIDLPKEKILQEKFNIAGFLVIYQGYLGPNRGIKEIVKSWEYVEKNINLIIMGDGPLKSWILDFIKKTNLSHVFYQSKVAPQEIIKYTSCADLGISIINPTCLSYHFASPNKMWEYITSQVPVMVNKGGEMEKIVEKYRVGLAVDLEGSNSIADEINIFFAKANIGRRTVLKKNCMIQAEKELNWKQESKKFLKLYQSLL